VSRAPSTRLTGGGFGGAIVALTYAGAARDVAARTAAAYEARTGRHATILVPDTGAPGGRRPPR